MNPESFDNLLEMIRRKYTDFILDLEFINLTINKSYLTTEQENQLMNVLSSYVDKLTINIQLPKKK